MRWYEEKTKAADRKRGNTYVSVQRTRDGDAHQCFDILVLRMADFELPGQQGWGVLGDSWVPAGACWGVTMGGDPLLLGRRGRIRAQVGTEPQPLLACCA